MTSLRPNLLALVLGIVALQGASAHAQNFGSPLQRRKIVLVRKLPPTGHIDGSSIKVVVTGAAVPPDVAASLKSKLESMLIADDPRLRSEEDHPDAIVNCRVTSYSQPPPQQKTEEGIALGKKGGPLQNQQMTEITGLLTTAFEAQDVRARRSIAADTVTSKFDREYAAANTQEGKAASLAHRFTTIPNLPGATHLGKPADNEDRPPTSAELRDRLIDDTALQVASHLVNTSEHVDVYLARGGALDDVDNLADQKLWTRALEQLETMKPFDKPEDDAYRIYDLGVVNEALAYQAEDVARARKYLQEAAIDYGKAIEARPSEKNFLQPQTRIDTALAHYKVLGDRTAATVSAAAPPPAAAASETLTDADVISMVAAKLDEANILDTIQHAGSVKFDLTAHGQVDLAKGGVNGRIIAAMKQRSRAPQ